MQLERRNGLSELTRGARSLSQALGFLLTQQGALKTALIPAAVAVVVGGALAVAGLWGVLTIGASLGGASFAAAVGRVVVEVALGAVALFVSVLFAFALAQPMSRTALERLARRFSAALPRHPSTSEPTLPSSGGLASIGTAVRAIGVTLPTIGALEAMTLVAPEAAFVTEPLAFVVTALGLSWQLFDHPMSRLGWTTRERLRWMKENALLVLGFAVATQTMTLVPLLDLLVLPVGVLAATRLVALRGAHEPALPASRPLPRVAPPT